MNVGRVCWLLENMKIIISNEQFSKSTFSAEIRGSGKKYVGQILLKMAGLIEIEIFLLRVNPPRIP